MVNINNLSKSRYPLLESPQLLKHTCTIPVEVLAGRCH